MPISSSSRNTVDEIFSEAPHDDQPDKPQADELSPVWVVIPAAGVGKRMQADRPKQYLSLLGKTVLEHTLQCFMQHPKVAGVVLVVQAGDPYWAELKPTLQTGKPLHIAKGGKERADSVFNGLQMLQNTLNIPNDTWVLVHDAARPCVTQAEITQLLVGVQRDPQSVGGLLALPVRDTMKRQQAPNSNQQDVLVSHTESREGLWHALTPQMFRLGLLVDALGQALASQQTITDEASAIEWHGFSPLLIEGLSSNLKITRPADLDLATFFLKN
ncbi:MAG TPA: 2-C-methyl-D-erythritol 4-phosphate cytidylyltransferase [Thiothrix sp.]|nr:2-C-methyl-D-erythritol 4-phosphate cytidylyltransferase [Thiothrix sp.]